MLREKNAEINEILSKHDRIVCKLVEDLQNERTEREKDNQKLSDKIQQLTEAWILAELESADANGKLVKERKSFEKGNKTCNDLEKTVTEFKSEIEKMKKKTDSDTQEISRLRKQVRVHEKTIAEMKVNEEKIKKKATTKKNLRLEQERKEWKLSEVALRGELYAAKHSKSTAVKADKRLRDELKSTKKELEIAKKEIRILKSNPSQICTRRSVNRVASSTLTSFGGTGNAPNQLVSQVNIEPGIWERQVQGNVKVNTSVGSGSGDFEMDEDDDCQIVEEVINYRFLVPDNLKCYV
ncbi:unnamed protein product [Orchesella dallaii]|uniref:Uncharacterized protein n=1 Tax=Orchesella dallaii TaxID=48710 RepID=A0ABP1R4S4_9HEXA